MAFWCSDARRIPWPNSNPSGASGILISVSKVPLQFAPTATTAEPAPEPASLAEAPASLAEARQARWITRALEGDGSAFEALYRQYLGRVYALCRRLCRDENEAEELTQEAFVRAFEQLALFRGESAFGSWLHRLTVNVVLGKWRGQNRYRQRVLALDDFEDFDPPQPAKETNTIDLERAIARLPKGARTIFVLHDLEGYGHDEIAEITGLAVGTSKAQLHRARRLLREALGDTSHAS